MNNFLKQLFCRHDWTNINKFHKKYINTSKLTDAYCSKCLKKDRCLPIKKLKNVNFFGKDEDE
jgi:hypothetical protein